MEAAQDYLNELVEKFPWKEEVRGFADQAYTAVPWTEIDKAMDFIDQPVTPGMLAAIGAPLFVLGHLSIIFGRDKFSVNFADLSYIGGTGVLSAVFIAPFLDFGVDIPVWSLALAGFLLTNAFSHFLSQKPGIVLLCAYSGACLIMGQGLANVSPDMNFLSLSASLDLAEFTGDFVTGSPGLEALRPYLSSTLHFHGLPLAAFFFLLANFQLYVGSGWHSKLTSFGAGCKVTASVCLCLSHALQRLEVFQTGHPEAAITQFQLNVGFLVVIGLIGLHTLYSFCRSGGGRTPESEAVTSAGQKAGGGTQPKNGGGAANQNGLSNQSRKKKKKKKRGNDW